MVSDIPAGYGNVEKLFYNVEANMHSLYLLWREEKEYEIGKGGAIAFVPSELWRREWTQIKRQLKKNGPLPSQYSVCAFNKFSLSVPLLET